jgi:hypothetical protein
MYPSLFEEVEDDRFRESEDDKGFYSSEDDQLTYSDREEIEQALYAQIHYCQDTDYEEEFDDKCLENRNDHNSIEPIVTFCFVGFGFCSFYIFIFFLCSFFC